jgi:hypothetical protein
MKFVPLVLTPATPFYAQEILRKKRIDFIADLIPNLSDFGICQVIELLDN